MVETVLAFIEKVYNSIKYNGFYILLSLVFPLIIWKFDAGKEIIVSMSETAYIENMLFSLVAFAGLGFSVWCIPTLAIKFFQFVANYRVKGNKARNYELKICLFKQLIFIYNGDGNSADTDAGQAKPNVHDCISTCKKREQIPMRYFAIMPWILFILTCVRCFFAGGYVWLAMILLLGIIVLVLLFINKKENGIVKQVGKIFSGGKDIRPARFTIGMVTIAIVVTGIWVRYFIFSDKNIEILNINIVRWIVVALHIICLFLFYSFIIYLENEHFTEKDSYKISNVSYKALVIFLLISIVAFYYLNEYQQIQYISPINVIIVVATLLIVFFEFFFTSQHLLISIINKQCTGPACRLQPVVIDNSKRLRGYKYSLYFVLAFLIYQFFFSSLNSHRIRIVPAEHINRERLSLTEYFDRWYRNRNLPDTDSIVYLVSGQGGGSRAAAHFYATMAFLDKQDSNFFKRVFCISTASGSTSGAEMFLASKYYYCSMPYPEAIKKAVVGLYGRNYMSSAFWGLMVGDGIEYYATLDAPFPHDRNYHLQKEELYGFNKVFGEKADDFFEKDFLTPYSDTTRHWPLFMINTTVVDYGVRGIFSPVEGDFSLARDLYSEFRKDNYNAGFDLPLTTCVNQSQAFPLLSAYNYLECTGRLADGGIVENTGCATTLEVYEAIRAYCNSTGKKVKVICLNLYNSSLSENVRAPFTNASVLNTVTAAAHSPFDGAQFYAYKNLSRTIKYLDSLNLGINRGDTVIDFGFDTSVTLTRTLSAKAVEIIYNRVKNYKL